MNINKKIEKKFRKELMEAYEQAASFDDASDIECAIRRGLSFILKEVIPMVRKEMEKDIRGRKIIETTTIDFKKGTTKKTKGEDLGEYECGFNDAIDDVLDLLNKQTKEKI
jgi:hypothetical protein